MRCGEAIGWLANPVMQIDRLRDVEGVSSVTQFEITAFLEFTKWPAIKRREHPTLSPSSI